MRYRDGRRSVCVSSQSGCPLTCTFCATGQMRSAATSRASEILDQALHFRRIEPINHLVFMGMGEPMLNLDAVLEAARRLPDVGVTHRRTTVSTVGWLPGLRRFVDEVEEPIRLALSLHAPTDALRSELMPVNDRYPLEDVLAECRRYFELRGRKVFVEYVMLAGVNDRVEQAAELARLLDPKIFKVNLIPYNPTGRVRRARRRDGDRRVQGGARPRAPAGDGAPHARSRHRRRVRAARARRAEAHSVARSSARCSRSSLRPRSAPPPRASCTPPPREPARGLVRTRDGLVRVREIPVAEPVLLADVEAAPRMAQRCLGEADDGVDARYLPLTAGEVLRLALRSLAPVVPRRVRRVDHAVVVLAASHQPPDLVEEVDAELPVVERQALRASAGVQLERPRFSRYCWW